MIDEPLVFLDLETTGATPTHDRITEVGLVTVDNGKFTRQWSTLVNPGMRIPPMITSLTGISDEMVALAPGFDEIRDELIRHIDGRILIAHNARFDHGFLRNEFQRVGIRYNPRVLCTVKLSRRLYPQYPRHNLDTLLERHNIACSARHRAMGDARVLWDLLQVWIGEHGADKVRETAGTLLSTPALPSGLPDNAFDGLPEGAGVYIFYGDNDVVLYVGKSIHLRNRVMAHFSGDHRVAKDLRISSAVRRIECRQTAGELGALLLESKLVKTMSPVHNRRLRRALELHAWQWTPDDIEPPKLVSARDISPRDLGSLYGMFRSRSAATDALREIATSRGLCAILTGLEKKKTGPCFSRQIRRCAGACVGEESPAQHALRMADALGGLRMQTWPFEGRIGIRERSDSGNDTDLHILEHWCHIGTARSDDELEELQSGTSQPVFDLDTYRLLSRFLEQRSQRIEVIPLPPPA
jgi:DNA polymerase-3 subunit epsilon